MKVAFCLHMSYLSSLRFFHLLAEISFGEASSIDDFTSRSSYVWVFLGFFLRLNLTNSKVLDQLGAFIE